MSINHSFFFFFVVVQLLSCVQLCNPMNCSMPGFSVLHYLLEFAQTYVHWVDDVPRWDTSAETILCRLTYLRHFKSVKELTRKQQITKPTSEEKVKVALSCLTLCDPMDCSTPGFLVLHHLPESAQTYVHWVGDAMQPSHPPLTPSPPTFSLSQHQGIFQWVSHLHQVAKGLEL